MAAKGYSVGGQKHGLARGVPFLVPRDAVLRGGHGAGDHGRGAVRRLLPHLLPGGGEPPDAAPVPAPDEHLPPEGQAGSGRPEGRHEPKVQVGGHVATHAAQLSHIPGLHKRARDHGGDLRGSPGKD
ncbi:hypothetical protein CEXT_190771 [Caerostris extrusa]|uniref:Uncharacterized protein n=1 Tax=Caerostris extrusa TaxID=172846 RepID=A0AAV4VY26_CAEEX|nr:hypothetical protein CEXT_190771 [Caerostris extrusa]